MSDELGDSMRILLLSAGLVESVTFRRVQVDRTQRFRLNTDPEFDRPVIRTELECELVLQDGEMARLIGERSIKPETMRDGQDIPKRLLNDAVYKLKAKVRSVAYMAGSLKERLDNA